MVTTNAGETQSSGFRYSLSELGTVPEGFVVILTLPNVTANTTTNAGKAQFSGLRYSL